VLPKSIEKPNDETKVHDNQQMFDDQSIEQLDILSEKGEE
jgi:hypothetical protein